MDQRDWDAIQKKEKEILLYTSAEELVGNLLEDPNLREVTANELALFADRDMNDFLNYLRHQRCGFNILCRALAFSNQTFLANELVKTRDNIPQKDAPSYNVAPSRKQIFDRIIRTLNESTEPLHINVKGEKGIGSSYFLSQICKCLQDQHRYTVYHIDLRTTPVVLQRRIFNRFQNDIIHQEDILKRYCLFCIDNIDSELHSELCNYHEKQQEFLKYVLQTCQNDLKVSILVTSSRSIHHFDSVQLNKLEKAEMAADLKRSFTTVTDADLRFLQSVFEDTCCPLDCFLTTILYILHGRQPEFLISRRRDYDRMAMFERIFRKLSSSEKEILFVIYCLPCNAKLTAQSIESCINRHPKEEEMTVFQKDLNHLLQLNLLKKISVSMEGAGFATTSKLYTMKDANFYGHFRRFFESKYPKDALRYYTCGVNYFLNYTIRMIHDVKNLNELTKDKLSEWEDNIPSIAQALNPLCRNLEQKTLANRKLSEEVYQRRMFVLQKLPTVNLRIPQETLILAADSILNDFNGYHHRYADIEDKVKLRCQITDLSISSNIEISEIQNYLSSAIIEVRNLLDNTRHTPEQRENLRKKYYLRVLVPLGEVSIMDGKYDRAKECFKECLKLQSENKVITWMLKKRLKRIDNLDTNSTIPETDSSSGSSQLPSPGVLSPVDPGSNRSQLANRINFFLEMGDKKYILGELQQAYNYYFELWTQFHSSYMKLKEQEYILSHMGHLKLQKGTYLSKTNVENAIEFYQQANEFHYQRKEKYSNNIRIYLIVANLLINRTLNAKEILNSLINAQKHTKVEFFLTAVREDSKYRYSFKESKVAERDILTNYVVSPHVNYFVYSRIHYELQLDRARDRYNQEPLGSNRTFIEFPHGDIRKHIVEFSPSFLYRQQERKLAVYIKIPTTHI